MFPTRSKSVTAPLAIDCRCSLEAVSEDVAATVGQVRQAASEIQKLRASSAALQKAYWDQKEDLADARRQLAEALRASIQSEEARRRARDQAEHTEGRSQALLYEVIHLRRQLGRLTSAIRQSFQLDEHEAYAHPHRAAS